MEKHPIEQFLAETNKHERAGEEILKEIEQKILNREICTHSLAFLTHSILEEGLEAEMDGVKALNALKSIFENGIWSARKIRLDQKKGGKQLLKGKIWTGFGDKYTQNWSALSSEKIFNAITQYLDKCKMESKDIQKIDYDDMLQDTEFLKNIDEKYSSRKIINSPRTKIIFKYMKSESKSGIFGLMKKSYLHFGHNLISTWSPDLVSKGYKEEGKILGVDNLIILFKKPRDIHTHPLNQFPEEGIEVGELGISNKILPTNFLAVAITDKIDLNKIPQEVFDVIPNNLPIISADLKKVIRMPKKKDE